jgi:hypothetical protein
MPRNCLTTRKRTPMAEGSLLPGVIYVLKLYPYVWTCNQKTTPAAFGRFGRRYMNAKKRSNNTRKQ